MGTYLNSQLFANDGDPLIVLPKETLLAWEGGDTPAAGRKVEATFRWRGSNSEATDYDRACDCDLYSGVIKVGQSWGLVISDCEGAGAACWVVEDGVEENSREVVFIVNFVSMEYDPNSRLFADLLEIEERTWTELSEKVSVDQGSLVLMHAACQGSEVLLYSFSHKVTAAIGDAISLDISPGDYKVLGSKVVTSDAEAMTYRFQRLASR